MNIRDEVVVRKIMDYCDEIMKTHAYFSDNKDLFYDKEKDLFTGTR
jgi:hypothetical protein